MPWKLGITWITWHYLDYLDVDNMMLNALETNQDHSVIFEIAPRYCILDFFVDYEGYSISSKGFLPSVVDIWSSELNSPISIQFSSLIPKMPKFTFTISYLTVFSLP